MSLVHVIANGTMTIQVVNSASSIRRRPAKLTFRISGPQSRATRGHKPWRVSRFLLLLLAFSVVFGNIAIAQVDDVRRVLILNDFDEIASPGIALLDQGVFAALNRSRYRIEWYSENLEANLFTDEASQTRIRDGYIRKYKDRKPDLVIAVGPASLQFMVQARQKFFPEVPVVFCGSSEDMLEKLKPDSSFTGVWGVVQPEETLAEALRLQSGTRHIVVVGGVGSYDRHLEEIVKQGLRKYEARFEFTYLTDLDMPTLLRRVRQLPTNSIVLYTSIFQDAAGRHFIDANQSSPAVIAASNAPVFVLFDVNFGTGAVGGDIISFASDGKVAGQMATRILDGEPPQKIPVVKNADVWTFDWRALRRWGFKESNLPPGSMVVDRQPTLWESYKWYIVAVFSLIILESLLIAGLLWERRRRTRAETRYRLLFERNVAGVGIGSLDGRLLDCNDGWARILGYESKDEVLGRHASEFYFNPGERQALVDKLFDKQILFSRELQLRRKDGTPVWVLFNAAVHSDHDRPIVQTTMFDISEWKRAEEALQGMSGKLIEAQEQERARIGRELHDDISQRLALLSIQTEQLRENSPRIESGLQVFRRLIEEISNDVQDLAHDLHPAKLEYLGPVAGMKSWCREFGDRHKLAIDFASDVHSPVPLEIGISLFRVLQEGLQNALKHSGAKHIEVQLREHSKELHLVISDSGKGFDTEAPLQGRGLGLASMRERVRLVDGTISVESKPMRGTTIHVRVPLESKHAATREAV